MKFLLVSDIQGNLSAVRKLCKLEGPTFDAVVVAGDIGSGLESTHEVFRLLQHFACPILYVLGNWDSEVPYETNFGSNCHHLHLSPFKLGPVTFVGFSGCDSHWGLNPILAEMIAPIRHRYRKLLADHREAKEESERKLDECNAKYGRELAELASKARDKRKKRYKREVEMCKKRHELLLPYATLWVRSLEGSERWQKMLREEDEAKSKALQANRKALANVIAASALDLQKTVVVTHARLFRTVEDFPGLSLCVFGHSGPFADSTFKGTRFINTNALDIPIAARPKRLGKRAGWDDIRHINGGHYVTLEWNESGKHRVDCVEFVRNYPGWIPIPDLHVVGNPYLE